MTDTVPYPRPAPAVVPAHTSEAVRQRFNGYPVAGYFHLTCDHVDNGRGVMSMRTPTALRNPNGSVPGALILGAFDIAVATFAAAVTPADSHVVTSDLSAQFLAPAHGEVVTMVVEPLRHGSRLAVLHARLYAADQTLVATATATMVVQRGRVELVNEHAAPTPA